MLGGLKELLQERGYLSGLIIDETEHLPSSSAYRSRFGSLLRAYELVRFTPEHDYEYVEINRNLRRLHADLIAEVITDIQGMGGQDMAGSLHRPPDGHGEFTASIVIARCRETPVGSLRWHIRFETGLRPDLTVAVRMDRENHERLDYYLLPRIDLTQPALRLAEYNGTSLDAYRFDTLEYFFEMGARAKLLEVI